MAYFRSDIDIIGFFLLGGMKMSGSAELLNKFLFFFYLVGSPKVGGAGDGKHKNKYGHPDVYEDIDPDLLRQYQGFTTVMSRHTTALYRHPHGNPGIPPDLPRPCPDLRFAPASPGSLIQN